MKCKCRTNESTTHTFQTGFDEPLSPSATLIAFPTKDSAWRVCIAAKIDTIANKYSLIKYPIINSPFPQPLLLSTTFQTV